MKLAYDTYILSKDMMISTKYEAWKRIIIISNIFKDTS